MLECACAVLSRTWWQYDLASDWYAKTYHWLNLLEGYAWLVLAALVWNRYRHHRRSTLELAYGLAFMTFGLSDFYEAYRLTTWLILFKGLNLAALLHLRWIVIRRHYPTSRTY